MNKWVLILAAGVSFNVPAFAADVEYEMRVDGLTCPFCVATSEKALRKIKGVKNVSSNLEQGLLFVCTDETVEFTDNQLRELFLSKGFTYRSMTKGDSCDGA